MWSVNWYFTLIRMIFEHFWKCENFNPKPNVKQNSFRTVIKQLIFGPWNFFWGNRPMIQVLPGDWIPRNFNSWIFKRVTPLSWELGLKSRKSYMGWIAGHFKNLRFESDHFCDFYSKISISTETEIFKIPRNSVRKS